MSSNLLSISTADTFYGRRRGSPTIAPLVNRQSLNKQQQLKQAILTNLIL
ncbi:MAG: hypothetical protein ACOYCB_10495 [Fastidiosipilaceae bacterium]